MYTRNFSSLATTPARKLALELVEAAIQAASPQELLHRSLRVRDNTLFIRKRRYALRHRRVWVLGAGKAAAQMATTVEAVLGTERIHRGLVISAHDASGATPEKVQVLEGDHPLPGPSSESATRALLKLAEDVAPADLVLWLLSGGASAMLVAPVPGLALAEKQAVTQALLHSGATIDEINAVRKHLSAVKGGRLAQRLAPATVLTLAISDVVSGRPDVIGSGPTVADPTTYADALAVLDRYGLRGKVPPPVVRHLERGAAGGLPETPKPGDACFARTATYIVGSPGAAAQAAARSAQATGAVRTQVITDQLAGEARTVARVLGSIFRYRSQARPRRPQVLIAAGEVTVTVRGHGKGGRCQELAAALIPEIAGLPGCAVACAATDGKDFLDGVGGALVDGETADQAQEAGLRVEDYLQANDTHGLHRRLGTLLEMGPTGTNVCDIIVCVLGAG
ncbi:MAG TPA: DUF4147 domain-containing protein [Dehalococcoidia bacterium]|nr:DUF4147 domain-containing protein [Dehalococcoidia bacterium]